MNKIKFTFTEKIYLDVLLYNMSKSKIFKNSRKTSLYLLCSIMFLLGLLFIILKNPFISIFFIVLGLVIFMLFPKYLGFYYKRFFSNMVKSEEYRNRVRQFFEAGFYENSIEMKNESVEVKHNINSFEYITETSDYFYIKLNIGDFLIFPKEQIPNIEIFKNYLNHICIIHNLNYEQEMNWKWK